MNDYYFVEKIMGKRYAKETRQVQYFIKWQGYPQSQNTWEPKANLKSVLDMIEEFEADLKSRNKGTAQATSKPIQLISEIKTHSMISSPVLVKLRKIEGKYYVDDDDGGETTKTNEVLKGLQQDRSEIYSVDFQMSNQYTIPVNSLKSNALEEDNDKPAQIQDLSTNEQPKLDEKIEESFKTKIKEGGPEEIEPINDSMNQDKSPETVQKDLVSKIELSENTHLLKQLDGSDQIEIPEIDEQFEQILSPKTEQSTEPKYTRNRDIYIENLLKEDHPHLSQTIAQTERPETNQTQFLELQILFIIQQRLQQCYIGLIDQQNYNPLLFQLIFLVCFHRDIIQAKLFRFPSYDCISFSNFIALVQIQS